MPAPKVGGRYELRRQLEQRDGVLSFEGWDTQAQREVLALLMRVSGNGATEEQTRLLQFARLAGLAGATPDPALPAILDSGSDPPDQNGETAYYLIAEWVSGTTLDGKLPLDPGQAVAAVRSIGDGLGWARQHWAGASPSYDLDPARIVFADNGGVRLTSFGLPGLGGEEGEQGDVLALGNLLRTLLAGGSSNEARSLSAAQALALAQVIGRSTAPTNSRYPDIATFLDALQAALAGRQTPDPRFVKPTTTTTSPSSRAKKKKVVTDPLTAPLTVSPVPDQLADQQDDKPSNGSTVPSAPPSMGPVLQSTSHLVDAAEFTPPAPAAFDNGENERVTVIRGAVPPIVVQNPPSAAPPAFNSAAAAGQTQANPALHPVYRSGATSSTFAEPPPFAGSDGSEVGGNVLKRPPVMRPAPRLVDPQTGQLRGDLYVAGNRPSGAQRVIGSFTQSNQRIVYLVGAIIVLILTLLFIAIKGKDNQPAVASQPLTTATTVTVLVASPTSISGNEAATPTLALSLPFSATVAPPSATPAPSPTSVAPSHTALPPSPTIAPVAQATPCNISLADVPRSSPDYGPISAMICSQAFYPAPGGNFAPNTAVTRAEIAHAITAALNWPLDANAANPFRDVQPATPYYADILTVVEHGVMSGIASDQFNPSGKLSRIQAIRVIVKAAGWQSADPNTVAHYSDVQNNNPLFIYVEAAYAHGAIGPTPNGLLRPNDPATRKDVALMLNNMLSSK